jgi:hypothetical protein
MENRHFQSIIENIRRMPNVANTQEEYALMSELRLGSLTLLYMEHLRRTLIFMENIKFDNGDKDFVRVKLSNIIYANWGCPYDIINDCAKELRSKIHPGMGLEHIHLYFLWHFHKETIDKMGFNTILDPVEPIWIFFLRGGYLRTDQGLTSITFDLRIWNAITIKKYKMLLNKAEPFIDCNDADALDWADKKLLVDREAFFKKYVRIYTGNFD